MSIYTKPHEGHIRALREADLDSHSGISSVISAADRLSCAMKIELPAGLSNISAVVEQQKLFNELRTKFSKRLQKHLDDKFVAQREIIGEATDNGTLKLPRHHNLHKKLLPYRPLVLWLRSNDQTAFMSLVATYTDSVRTIYRKGKILI